MLTNKELKELNNFNAAAFDLLRSEAKSNNTKVPYWLCMSEESKQECRQKFVVWAKFNLTNGISVSLKDLESTFNKIPMQPIVSKWIRAEMLAKQDRENGGLSGFFC